MRYLFFLAFVVILITSCKASGVHGGSFALKNDSNKVIEFIWIAPKGEFFPTGRDLNIKSGDIFEIKGLKEGEYDIAIDFAGEYNTFNSKKDPALCLTISSGFKKIWIVDKEGNILRD